jgi:hypothetical protein
MWTFGSSAKETELKFFHPFSESSGYSKANIFEIKQGECLTQSKIIKREDAWRCIADGKTFDPCFAKHYGEQFDVICIATPWSYQSVQIKVPNSLQSAQHDALDMSRTFPWAIELSNGEKCQAVDSNEYYDQLPVRYICERDEKLLGHVQRCENTWKMLQVNHHVIETVEIERAWF